MNDTTLHTKCTSINAFTSKLKSTRDIAFNFYLIVTSKPVSTDNWFIGSVLTDVYIYISMLVTRSICKLNCNIIIRPHNIVKRGIFPNANQMEENMKFTCIYFYIYMCVCVIVMSWNNLWRIKCICHLWR